MPLLNPCLAMGYGGYYRVRLGGNNWYNGGTSHANAFIDKPTPKRLALNKPR